MTRRFATLAVLGALALTAGAVQAQEARFDREQVRDRFEQMDRMMEQRGDMSRSRRGEMLREHMGLMQDQMRSMHGMMGGSGQMGQGGMGQGQRGQGQTGQGRMGQGRMEPGGDPDARFEAMQERMDIMQQMMEQMLDQQEMMLRHQDEE